MDFARFVDEVKLEIGASVAGDMRICYLATPYSSSNYMERYERFYAVTDAAGKLFQSGINVYSPITHSHPINESQRSMSHLFEVWENYDLYVINKLCKGLIVLKIPGWKESIGVNSEINYANLRKLPVFYLDSELVCSSDSLVRLNNLRLQG